MKVNFNASNNRVTSVKKMKGQSGDFVHFQRGTFEGGGNVLLSFLKRYTLNPAAIKGASSFTLNIVFPAGYYNPSK